MRRILLTIAAWGLYLLTLVALLLLWEARGERSSSPLSPPETSSTDLLPSSPKGLELYHRLEAQRREMVEAGSYPVTAYKRWKEFETTCDGLIRAEKIREAETCLEALERRFAHYRDTIFGTEPSPF
ncbi:MAG: hypothetical protein D6795_11995 [Deltaproteobacteria bacterium]|nr:MAG: hypothetical protein D6795_11995 [Deltaproteobacteria bacterium]